MAVAALGRIFDPVILGDLEVVEPGDVLLVREEVGHLGQVVARTEMIADAADDEDLHVVVDIAAVDEIGKAGSARRW